MRVLNGCAMSNTGYRVLVFREDGGLAPVIACQDKGYQTECGTIQKAMFGDIAALNVWDSRNQRLYLVRVKKLKDVPTLGIGCPRPDAWGEVLWEGPGTGRSSPVRTAGSARPVSLLRLLAQDLDPDNLVPGPLQLRRRGRKQFLLHCPGLDADMVRKAMRLVSWPRTTTRLTLLQPRGSGS